MRLYGFRADGSLPNVVSFGGIDTLRTIPVYGLFGNTGGFFNLEFRFPLIDFLATPILGFQGIRGKAFIEVGGAALKNQPWQFWKDYRLCGAGLLCDGVQTRSFLLDNPAHGLCLGPMLFIRMRNFAPGTVLMVMASTHYDKKKSIRSWEEYLEAIGG